MMDDDADAVTIVRNIIIRDYATRTRPTTSSLMMHRRNYS